MIISGILSILGSSFMGTLLGGAFAFLNKKQDTALELAKLQHELHLRDKDIALATAEAQGHAAVAFEQAEGARFAAIGQAHAADVTTGEQLKEAGFWRFLFVWAEAYRKVMRPAITTALLGAALWANYIVFTYLQSAWPNIGVTGQLDLVLQAFGWVSGQASACVAYWMVSRGAPK
jgi:hypothetical protein